MDDDGRLLAAASLLLLLISYWPLGCSAQPAINCPAGRYTNCYNVSGTAGRQCCFGYIQEPEVHVNDVALMMYDAGLQPFASNTRIEHCLFLIVHDFVSQGSATWISNLAYSIQNIGKCIVQSKTLAQSGQTKQSDAMRREPVQYNPEMPYRKVAPTILIVDWAGPAMTPYATAAASAKMVGRILAEKMAMHRQFVAKRPNIHCIGQGLGAHVCGIAGSNYALGQFMRITALDPARPLFEPSLDGVDVSLDDRLDYSDAKFVDAIHTTSDLGFITPLGHVDFYVNGNYGRSNISKPQPGCTQFSDSDRSQLCSHQRAREIFQSSFQRQCVFKSCYGSTENERCHAGWSSYRCKGFGEYCGYVELDPSGLAQCYDPAALRKTTPETTTRVEYPITPAYVQPPPPPPAAPARRQPAVPQLSPQPTTDNRAPQQYNVHSYNHHQSHYPYPPDHNVGSYEYYPAAATTKSAPQKAGRQTTTMMAQLLTERAYSPSVVDGAVEAVEAKPFYSLSLFTDLGGNCAGNSMIVFKQQTLEQCAKYCLETLGCAGFSVERLHPGPTYTCIIKSKSCLHPNTSGDFKFYRREI